VLYCNNEWVATIHLFATLLIYHMSQYNNEFIFRINYNFNDIMLMIIVDDIFHAYLPTSSGPPDTTFFTVDNDHRHFCCWDGRPCAFGPLLCKLCKEVSQSHTAFQVSVINQKKLHEHKDSCDQEPKGYLILHPITPLPRPVRGVVIIMQP
jgi:hypothetical protein